MIKEGVVLGHILHKVGLLELGIEEAHGPMQLRGVTD